LVLKPTKGAKEYHGDKIGIKKTIQVDQVRLDSVIKEEIDVLKFDLQGYELEALKGCTKIFEKTRLILLEVEFVYIYENQPLFAEIDMFLRSKGFALFNLYDLYTRESGQLSAGDALYLNTKYF